MAVPDSHALAMHRIALLLSSSLLVVAAQAQTWGGKWYTTRGVLQLDAEGEIATGRYGDENRIEGTIEGTRLSWRATEGNARAEGSFELQAGGHAFRGSWRDVEWLGWREDPKAKQGRAARVAGFWRTSWGMLELEQKGNALSGGLGAQGWTNVRGELRARHLRLRYDGPFGPGELWLDVAADGASAFGAAVAANGRDWPLRAQRLDGHARDVTPKPGAVVSGIGKNRLTYHLRAPKNWKRGARVPLLLFLHGSNMGARPYVESIAAVPEIADRYLIVGVDGERWVDSSRPEDPRHNYTYVNWMGRSTYEGFPNTHRESPALIAELIEELRARLAPTHLFAGGHSQGGFLSFFLLMHFPELVDGVFPMSCGLVIQCEPDVFAEAKLKERQRQVPLAIVHGERDDVVPFAQGRAAHASFEEQGFPYVRMFRNAAGHGFSSLPWLAAVDWLETLAAGEPARLLAHAGKQLAAGDCRDAAAALLRVRARKTTPAEAAAAADLARQVDALAAPDAERLLAAIRADADGSWADDFVAFRAKFGPADAAQPVLAAHAALREKHEAPAKKLFGEARQAFQQGDRAAGWRKYEQLVRECYASSLYTRVKQWLAEKD
jgi:predicted esterase